MAFLNEDKDLIAFKAIAGSDGLEVILNYIKRLEETTLQSVLNAKDEKEMLSLINQVKCYKHIYIVISQANKKILKGKDYE